MRRTTETADIADDADVKGEERCENRKDIKAKVSAANVLGENAEH